MKVMTPETEADDQAEIQPGNGGRDRIEGAEDEAHCRLPAHEAGNGVVHLAGDLADGLAIVRRRARDRPSPPCGSSRSACRRRPPGVMTSSENSESSACPPVQMDCSKVSM